MQQANYKLGHNSPLYLATDSYKVKKIAREMFPGRIRVLNIQLQHVAMVNSVTTVSHNLQTGVNNDSGGTDEIDAFDGTWVDFLLLARSHTMVRGVAKWFLKDSWLFLLRFNQQSPLCTQLHQNKATDDKELIFLSV